MHEEEYLFLRQLEISLSVPEESKIMQGGHQVWESGKPLVNSLLMIYYNE